MSDDEPKQQTSTTTTTPWGPSQPLLKKTINRATNLFDSGGLRYRYFPGETVAPKTQETTDAWQMISDRARSGSPLVGQSKGYIGDVLSGKYLGAESPGLQGVLNRTRNAVAADKIMAGRYRSEAHDAALADAFAPIIYQDYARERQLMDEAARFAPTLAQQDYTDADRLQSVGAQREAYGQDLINEAINRFNFEQNAPANEIALAQQLAGGNLGGTTYSTQPVMSQGYNPFMQALGTGFQALPYFFGA